MIATSDTTHASVSTVMLFTDLIDSTRWKEQIGDRDYATFLRRPHDDLFRKTLTELSAVERDNAGDGFLVTFRTPSDAVRFAVRFHRALAGFDWAAPIRRAGVPVTRIGIHVGEVVEFDDPSGKKVSGQAVDLAARVMGLAGGGRTLLTRHAFDSARQHIRDEPLGWVAHGQYRFKGKEDDPLEVFEVGELGRHLPPPPDGEKARRVVVDPTDDTGAWRPAVGLTVPRREEWILESQLGEGGFGEVWLARQRRTKEPRVFKFCFDVERLRSFKRELTFFRLIQSELGNRPDFVKLLDVQVDRPPYTLESEYVPGGNLGDWIDQRGGMTEWPLAERLNFLVMAGRAVAAAHSLGIIHKDVKPSNVFVRMAEGHPSPVLADFGIGILTGRSALNQGNVTVTGFTESVMFSNNSSRTGTRLYAPPESQTGKPATTGTDVYALGVMLFQFVIGDMQRPLGTGWADAINTGDADRDALLIEDITAATFVDPARRLSTAVEFAERLERQSVRIAERKDFATQAERNRQVANQIRRLRIARRLALASAFVTVALSVLAGVAWVQKGIAEDAREKEQDALKKETAARRDADFAKGKAVEEKLNAQRMLVRALLAPMAEHWNLRLSEYEREAIWDLALLRDGEVGTMFAEHAAKTHNTSRQFKNRREYLWHALVGLDPLRAHEIESVLVQRLQDKEVPIQSKVDLALILAEHGRSNKSIIAITDLLQAALAKEIDQYARRPLAAGLSSAAERLAPDKAADLLLAALAKETDYDARGNLAAGLAAAAGRLPPDKAAELCGRAADLLLAALAKETGYFAQRSLVLGILAMTSRMPTANAAELLLSAVVLKPNVFERQSLASRAATTAGQLPLIKAADLLLPALARETDDNVRRSLATGLAAAATRLPPDKAADFFLATMDKQKGALVRESLADCLTASTSCMYPAKAADILLAALAKETDHFARRPLAAGLAAAAGQLPPDKAADLLLTALAKETNNGVRAYLAEGVAAAAGRLPPDKAADLCGRVADLLLAALATATFDRRPLAAGLSSAAERLAPDKAADLLLAALAKETDHDARGNLAAGLAAAAGRLPPDKAAELCGRAADLLLAALAKETDQFARRPLAAGLVVVAGQFPSDKAAEVSGRAADLILDAPYVGSPIAPPSPTVLATLSLRVSHDKAVDNFRRATDLYLAALGKESGRSRAWLAAGLSSAAERLAPDKAADLLLAALAKETNHDARGNLAAGLAAAAGRLPPDKAAELCGRAADLLLAALAKETDQFARRPLAAGLVVVAGQLPSDKAAVLLLTARDTGTDYLFRQTLAKGLVESARRMPPDKAANLLLTALINKVELSECPSLAGGLMAVTKRLPSDRAAEVSCQAVDSLFATLSNMTDVSSRQYLATAIGAIVVRLPPEQVNSQRISTSIAGLVGSVTFHPQFLPTPEPLSAPLLVDLLKHPLCVKEARRSVLDALELIYHRTFSDLWEFIAYAKKSHPELDLHTPPRRPQKIDISGL